MMYVHTVILLDCSMNLETSSPVHVIPLVIDHAVNIKLTSYGTEEKTA